MQALVCYICREDYNRNDNMPFVLPCGHTFCFPCIKGKKESCSLCRSTFRSNELKINFSLNALLEEIEELSPDRNPELSSIFPNSTRAKTKQVCGKHQKLVDRYCKECSKSMCLLCYCDHSLKLSTETLESYICEACGTAREGHSTTECSSEVFVKVIEKIKIYRPVHSDLIITSSDLREEVETIFKSEASLEKQKKEFCERIDRLAKSLINEIQESAQSLKQKFLALKDLRKCNVNTLEDCGLILKQAENQTKVSSQYIDGTIVVEIKEDENPRIRDSEKVHISLKLCPKGKIGEQNGEGRENKNDPLSNRNLSRMMNSIRK